jgi:hypothetical protein
MCNAKKQAIMEISANILAQMRKNCAPEMSGVQKKVSNFVNRNGGKLREDFWAVFNTELSLSHDVMVCVQPDRKVRILSVRRNRSFAHHVGELLKTHKVCWVWGEDVIDVDWENWKAVYGYLVPVKHAQVYDPEMSEYERERHEVERNREEMFYEQATSNRYKKMGKRGYNLSFNEMRAVRRMEAAERQAYRTVKYARSLMEAM